jgi:hypothetical protein
MLRKLMTVALAGLALVGVQVAALASDTGTADEAKATVEKAVKLIESDGRDKAFAVVNDNEGPSSANPCST